MYAIEPVFKNWTFVSSFSDVVKLKGKKYLFANTFFEEIPKKTFKKITYCQNSIYAKHESLWEIILFLLYILLMD